MAKHRYGLISDSHGPLNVRVLEAFADVDAIIHAGDVGDEMNLNDLESLQVPVYAVSGNCDYSSERMPPYRKLELPFGRLMLIHCFLKDPTCGNPRIIASCYSSLRPRVIVLGHSHVRFRSQQGNVWIVNPGSAWKSRSSEPPSVTIMAWDSNTDEFSFEDIFLD